MFTTRIYSTVKLIPLCGVSIFFLLTTPSCSLFDSSPKNAAITEGVGVANASNINDIARLITEMRNSISSRQSDQTKAIFSQIQVTWEAVKPDVQVKSASGYDAIEIHLENIETNLNASETDMALLKSDLQLLEVVVNNLAQ